jgi:hypothetical protein
VRTIIGEVAVRYSQCFKNTLKILESKSCQLSLRLAEGKNQVNFQATGAKTTQVAEEKKRRIMGTSMQSCFTAKNGCDSR